jgi:hypothetical protein
VLKLAACALSEIMLVQTAAYVSIRQHTSAYVASEIEVLKLAACALWESVLV